MAKTFKFSYSGIAKIKIPKDDADFSDAKKCMQILDDYLPSILQQHKKNRLKIKYLYEYAFGNQDISEKKRLYNKDAKNNNILVENHPLKPRQRVPMMGAKPDLTSV